MGVEGRVRRRMGDGERVRGKNGRGKEGEGEEWEMELHIKQQL